MTSNDGTAGRTVRVPIKALKGMGVGDAVARISKAMGIKPCAKCKERQAKLNRWKFR